MLRNMIDLSIHCNDSHLWLMLTLPSAFPATPVACDHVMQTYLCAHKVCRVICPAVCTQSLILEFSHNFFRTQVVLGTMLCVMGTVHMQISYLPRIASIDHLYKLLAEACFASQGFFPPLLVVIPIRCFGFTALQILFTVLTFDFTSGAPSILRATRYTQKSLIFAFYACLTLPHNGPLQSWVHRERKRGFGDRLGSTDASWGHGNGWVRYKRWVREVSHWGHARAASMCGGS